MTDAMSLRSIEVDLAVNTLRLVLADTSHAGPREISSEPATIDIGTGGRLVGVELSDGYLDVMPPEPGTEHLIRSARAEVLVERSVGEVVALVVHRAGAGYEITYPSGNQ